MYFMCFNFVENDCVYKNYAFIAHMIKLVVMGSVAGRPSLGLTPGYGVQGGGPSGGRWVGMSYYL